MPRNGSFDELRRDEDRTGRHAKTFAFDNLGAPASASKLASRDLAMHRWLGRLDEITVND